MLNEENLLKLASKLDSLPDDYAAFEMRTYFGTGPTAWDRADAEVERNYALHNGGVDTCGAVACAVGHGPAAGILVPEDLVDAASGRAHWARYIDRFFIHGYMLSNEGEPDDIAYHWMFGHRWAEFDNTPKGAARRIRWLLANGVDAIPTRFDDYNEVNEVAFSDELLALYADA